MDDATNTPDRMGLARHVAALAAERGVEIIWFGQYQFLQDAFARKYGDNVCRPAASQIRNVMTAVSKSRLFQRAGCIRSVGFSAKETLHPAYRLAPPTTERTA